MGSIHSLPTFAWEIRKRLVFRLLTFFNFTMKDSSIIFCVSFNLHKFTILLMFIITNTRIYSSLIYFRWIIHWTLTAQFFLSSYRKPIFSGRILNYFSNHHFNQKRTIVFNQVHSDVLLSDDKFHSINWKIVFNILLANSNPPPFIKRLNKLKLLVLWQIPFTRLIFVLVFLYILIYNLNSTSYLNISI